MVRELLIVICCLVTVFLVFGIFDVYFMTAENLDNFRDGIKEVYDIFDI